LNTLYQIYLKIECKPVLVVGGGKVAEQKINGLMEAKAKITVISPHVTEGIDAFEGNNEITLHRRTYQGKDVEGYILVFGATNNPSVHKEIFDDAVAHNVPVNIVDVPDLCSFYLASIFQNGDLKVAVSTNGKSPTLGKIIRDRIAAEFSKGYPELLETLGDLRPSVHSIYAEANKRKSVFETIVDDEIKRRNLPVAQPEKSPPPANSLKPGKVYLVGAGPGDPELITVKGLRILEHADVVAYDALVCFELLSSTKPDCEKIFVGKRSGGHYVQQKEINALLAQKAKEGKNVVRLKGGDPFVFGRGGEELESLREAGVEIEIVPGITAGTGVPSTLGIPLTHRGISSNVVFVTGSENPGKENSADWKNVAAVDTIVVYMGIKNLLYIVTKLTEAGRPQETPVAAIFGGTTSEEIVLEGTLQTINEKVEQVETDAPGIVIIGDVVGFLNVDNGGAFMKELSI
jgi:uroporphyrin-III C-methyltransferase/precorrin-2 dehydrogenase/sirohydrochlorin ferrochelatase